MKVGTSTASTIAIVLCLTGSISANTLYVDDDAPPGGNGGSWEMAFRYLQDALYTASPDPSVDEIRVAAGTYKPDQDEVGVVTPGDRAATFQLLGGVSLLGGYAGIGAPDPDLRDLDAYPSRLNGDLNGDDTPVFGNTGDNSYHVVTINAVTPAAVLDGFRVIRGFADTTASNTHGGGLLCRDSELIINDCIFWTNFADGSGGAMDCADSTVSASGCQFLASRAARDGGGVSASQTELTLEHCEFDGNAAGQYGGGLHCSAGPDFRVRGCVFSDNSCRNGGGGYLYGPGAVIECTFHGNTADMSGGGLDVSTDIQIIGCKFVRNVSDRDGSGIHIFGDTTVANCVLVRNEGGAAIAYGSGTEIVQCTVFGNTAGVEGPGGSRVTLANSILWANGTPGLYDEERQLGLFGLPFVHHCCVMGWTGDHPGVATVGYLPRFVNAAGPDGVTGTEDDDFRLSPDGSPCIDAGDNRLMPPDRADLDGDGDTDEPLPLDFDGAPRIRDDPGSPDAGYGTPAVVDIGVYEFQGETVPPPVRLYVDVDATGANDGTRWSDAYVDLQDAIATAQSWPRIVKDIWVAEGTYHPDRGTGDRSGTFKFVSPVPLYGGFAGFESERGQRDIQGHPTILSGDLGTGGHSYHVLSGTAVMSGTYDGFSITGGRAAYPAPVERGGGVFVSGGRPSLVNCAIFDNEAEAGGGVFNADDGHLTLTNCVLFNNVAEGGYGGAIRNEGSAITISNCTVVQNENLYAALGAGLYSDSYSDEFIHNSIFWNNTVPSGDVEGAQLAFSGDPTEIRYNCVEGWTGQLGGEGNMGEDPALVDPEGDDFRLTAASPCVDRGRPDPPPSVAVDFEGEPRVQHCRVDIGADESQYFVDCNDNGLADGCEISDGTGADCNGNSIPDDCDIASGTSEDRDGNGVPDECDAAILRVDGGAPPGGDGSTWELAYADLLDALDAAAASGGVVREIWVAEGVYRPDRGSGDRAATFNLADSIALYGGFRGGEARRDHRDWQAAPTILSGDIGVPGDPIDNSYHVVTALDNNNAPTLDGFTITDGYADGDAAEDDGAGMYIDRASVVLRHCRFTRNHAADDGGGIMCPCTTTLIDCSFDGNSAENHGGAVRADEDGTLVVTGCDFRGNQAANGGAIYAKGSFQSLFVTNCIFRDNLAFGSGGAVLGFGPTEFAMVNCLFADNWSRRNGGGLYLLQGGFSTVTNCTFAGNHADERGGGYFGASDFSRLDIANSIFWGNSAGEGSVEQAQVDGQFHALRFSCVEGWTGVLGGVGNTGEDPQFVGGLTPGSDPRLRPMSPCIDAGANSLLPPDADDLNGNGDTDERIPLDLEDNDRFRDDPGVPDSGSTEDGSEGPVVDMGAFEFQLSSEAPAERLYVDSDVDAASANDGSSWADAYRDLGEALNIALAHPGIVREIWVRAGVHKPDAGCGVRGRAFRLPGGVAVYGGFAGGETQLDERNSRAHLTVLSGDIGEPGFAADNSYHVLVANDPAGSVVLDGFTIAGGYATGAEPHDRGAGLYADGGDLAIINCLFEDNHASEYAGGVLSRNSTLLLSECVFLGNSSSSGGGMRATYGSTVDLRNCLFNGNLAHTWSGGAINMLNSTLAATASTFANNEATTAGGGALRNSGACDITMNSCVLWDNRTSSGMPDEVAQISSDAETTVAIDYTCLQGWTGSLGGVGNIGDDPLFLDPVGPDGEPGTADDDLRQAHESPCINTGDPDIVPEPGETDLDGRPRLLCTRIDMGAYEYGLGDYNCDGVVDLSDYAAWGSCFAGPDAGPYDAGCEAFDAEYDGDVDLLDFVVFQWLFGPAGQ